MARRRYHEKSPVTYQLLPLHLRLLRASICPARAIAPPATRAFDSRVTAHRKEGQLPRASIRHTHVTPSRVPPQKARAFYELLYTMASACLQHILIPRYRNAPRMMRCFTIPGARLIMPVSSLYCVTDVGRHACRFVDICRVAHAPPRRPPCEYKRHRESAFRSSLSL